VDVTVILTSNITGALTYKITSTAVTYDSGNTAALASGTIIESYLLFTPGGELDIFSGVLSSKGDIEFKGPCSAIEGSIYVGGTISGCYLQDPPDVTPVTADDFPRPAQDLAFAEALKAEAMAGGNHTGDMNVDSSMTLNSMYITGNLNINSDFTLAGIVYVKGGIHVDKDITINGSGSSIALVAEGDIYFQKVSTSGNTGDLIIMSLSSDGIEFRKEATLSALIYAPNGQIWFKKEATVEGGIVGASIRVENDASLTYIQKASGFDLPGGLPGAYTIETYDVSRLS
jgi:cytoskeletal protein CcmA (bactofilin family)